MAHNELGDVELSQLDSLDGIVEEEDASMVLDPSFRGLIRRPQSASERAAMGWKKFPVYWWKNRECLAPLCLIIAFILIGAFIVGLVGITRWEGEGFFTQDEERKEAEILAKQIEFDTFMSDYWKLRCTHDPLLATYTGDAQRFGVEHLLPNNTVDSIHVYGFELERRKEILKTMQPSSEFERINQEVLLEEIDLEMASIYFREYLIAVNSLEGPQVDLPLILPLQSFETEENYRAYIDRLSAVDDYISSTINLLNQGIAAQLVQPCAVLDSVEDQIAGLVVSRASDSPFYEPFDRLQQLPSVGWHQRVISDGTRAINDHLPHGDAYYDFLVRKYTSDPDMTPAAIHSLGLSEVERIKGEIKSLYDESRSQASLESFVENFRTNRQFYVDDDEEFLARIYGWVAQIQPYLPSMFATLPRCPFGVQRIPPTIAGSSAIGFYEGSDADCTRPGEFSVNTRNVSAIPLWALPPLILHESTPGHHLQIALQNEMKLPSYRRHGEWTAYVEGWALYAESLMGNTPLFKSLSERFGMLDSEMFRAVRLVVDSGIHSEGWEQEQAVEYMMANTADSEEDIRSEVVRYIGWPGQMQALAYKSGQLAILQLRDELKAEYGLKSYSINDDVIEGFDIRVYHDRVLEMGSVPLHIMRERVRKWFRKNVNPSSQ